VRLILEYRTQFPVKIVDIVTSRPFRARDLHAYILNNTLFYPEFNRNRPAIKIMCEYDEVLN